MTIDKLIAEVRTELEHSARTILEISRETAAGLLDHLASTHAEILRLKAALADAQAMSDAHREHAQSAIENCASLKYSLSHANAALEPFAKAARKAGYYPHSHLLATREVTIHDFRRADTALSLDAAPPSGEAT